MQITAQQICTLLGGTLEGNPDAIIRKPSKIEESEPDSICFLGNPKYAAHLYTTKAAAVLVSHDFVAEQPVATTLIRVADVYTSVSFLLEKFGSMQQDSRPAVVHQQAVIAADATLGVNVSIAAFVVIEGAAQTERRRAIPFYASRIGAGLHAAREYRICGHHQCLPAG